MRALGFQIETLALKFLQNEGLVLLHRNFTSRYSEIDLICQHGDNLVFIEVRYRTHLKYGSALESVHRGKQRKIILAARYFLGKNPKYAAKPCRFDVIAVTLKENQPKIEWIQNAFC
jgi:putative endonuclease